MRVLPCKAVIAFALGLGACTTGNPDIDDYDDNVAGMEVAPGPAAAEPGAEIAAVLNLTQFVNPLIGTPEGYPVVYPWGGQIQGVVSGFDYRVGLVSLPTSHAG